MKFPSHLNCDEKIVSEMGPCIVINSLLKDLYLHLIEKVLEVVDTLEILWVLELVLNKYET